MLAFLLDCKHMQMRHHAPSFACLHDLLVEIQFNKLGMAISKMAYLQIDCRLQESL